MVACKVDGKAVRPKTTMKMNMFSFLQLVFLNVRQFYPKIRGDNELAEGL